jgi:hypothetical protein
MEIRTLRLWLMAYSWGILGEGQGGGDVALDGG